MIMFTQSFEYFPVKFYQFFVNVLNFSIEIKDDVIYMVSHQPEYPKSCNTTHLKTRSKLSEEGFLEETRRVKLSVSICLPS